MAVSEALQNADMRNRTTNQRQLSRKGSRAFPERDAILEPSLQDVQEPLFDGVLAGPHGRLPLLGIMVPSEGDNGGGANGGSREDAEQIGIGERVAHQGLHRAARDTEPRADDNRQQRPGESQVPDDNLNRRFQWIGF